MNMESPVEWKEPGRCRPHTVARMGDRLVAPENTKGNHFSKEEQVDLPPLSVVCSSSSF